jgi:hypothetical protein
MIRNGKEEQGAYFLGQPTDCLYQGCQMHIAWFTHNIAPHSQHSINAYLNANIISLQKNVYFSSSVDPDY